MKFSSFPLILPWQGNSDLFLEKAKFHVTNTVKHSHFPPTQIPLLWTKQTNNPSLPLSYQPSLFQCLSLDLWCLRHYSYPPWSRRDPTSCTMELASLQGPLSVNSAVLKATTHCLLEVISRVWHCQRPPLRVGGLCLLDHCWRYPFIPTIPSLSGSSHQTYCLLCSPLAPHLGSSLLPSTRKFLTPLVKSANPFSVTCTWGLPLVLGWRKATDSSC